MRARPFLLPTVVGLLTSTVVGAAPTTPSSMGRVDLAGRDLGVRPGDDFEVYANGGWRAQTEIPADRSSTGTIYEVFKKAEARTAEIIKGASTTNPSAGSDARRIADHYAAFMDVAGIEKRGLAPIQVELGEIAGLADKRALATYLGSTLRADTDPLNSTHFATENLFGLFVTQSLNDPARTVPYLMQGGLGLPDRDYYLSQKPEMADIRAAYRLYIEKFLTLAGQAEASARADRIIALEMKIAAVHADIERSQDVHKGNNPWGRADFSAKAPGLDWDAFFTSAALGDAKEFVAWQPAAIAGIAVLVASEPLQSWQDWLVFHRINQVSFALPKALDDAHFDFYGKTLSGTPEQRTRDKRAIAAVSADLGDAVGHLYADRHFPASSRADIQTMVRGIVAAFDRRVATLDWMAAATKAEARRKIETMRVGIGYPDRWRDYASLEIRSDDPVGNFRRAEIADYRQHIGKIGKPVDPGEWWMTPQTVNAVNLPLQNALNFPAAILEAPFYDPKADAAANYGSIGAVIGHEISHGFDNLGADFDAEGRLRNWWTPADFAHFKQAGAALVTQYNAYVALPGLTLKGSQELGENIADLAGLTAAYEAYHMSLGGKPAPVIAGLTGDQRFFLAFATSWRDKSRDKALRMRVAVDVHAPARFRAQTVRNLDAWYKAFGVTPGSALYLPPEKRVRVW